MDRLAALDRKIEIMQPVVTVSDSGQERTTFTVWRTTFANVVERFGNEGIQAGEVTATTVVDFTIRYRAGLTHAMHIVFNGNKYNIQAITEAEVKGQFNRDRFTKVTAIHSTNNNNQQF
jgi:SPP1 family predicted phage head-tail adaptor